MADLVSLCVVTILGRNHVQHEPDSVCLLLDRFGRTRHRFATESVARQWNELLLESIRNDFARPTVHARNLFHTSAAMWDAWSCLKMAQHLGFSTSQ